MKNIFISDVAYKEFKELLDENNVESYNIRINISEYTCGGPIFDIMVSDANSDDDTEVINDITFIVEKSILSEYGGFIIVSNEENNGNGVGLKPVVLPSTGCGNGCSGCGGDCGGCSNN
nr:HesB-like protein [Sedimentibacter sp.]